MQFSFSLEHMIYNKTLHLEFSGELVGKIQSSYQTKVVIIINCIMVSGMDCLCYKSFVSLWLYFGSYNININPPTQHNTNQLYLFYSNLIIRLQIVRYSSPIDIITSIHANTSLQCRCSYDMIILLWEILSTELIM